MWGDKRPGQSRKNKRASSDRNRWDGGLDCSRDIRGRRGGNEREWPQDKYDVRICLVEDTKSQGLYT